ncbi:MAG: C_GCAxxG_C_C family protein, partial [Thermoguttaceae bacterium]|nr:C_GCAxxG_C_C family protein [Thermoguttaceae bacterium]
MSTPNASAPTEFTSPRAVKARALFEQGYNCAQAVFLAFLDETGLDEKTAARISSSFGGGMGRLREVCGAVSGMFLVLGTLRGADDPKDSETKTAQYRDIQELARRFRESNGSII